ncbi:hypothetical protein [Aeromonas veronii]|nr:hypothetical protein [Aeromonas veronii]
MNSRPCPITPNISASRQALRCAMPLAAINNKSAVPTDIGTVQY